MINSLPESLVRAILRGISIKNDLPEVQRGHFDRNFGVITPATAPFKGHFTEIIAQIGLLSHLRVLSPLILSLK